MTFSLALHVPNVWQTCEWYRLVFGVSAVMCADASAARLDVPGLRLLLVDHSAQEALWGPRRLHSFLHSPPAFHLAIGHPQVQSAFDRAITHGAVPLHEPQPAESGRLQATLRDLNGLLVLLTEINQPAL